MRSKLIPVLWLIAALFAVGTVGNMACATITRLNASEAQAKADTKYLNETITTITQADGRQVVITRKLLIDFLILKNIEEMKQRQALEKGLERNGSR